jgi:YVTN family beta-propeller protein
VSIVLRNDNELWVVNHLSDSVSVVDVSNPMRPRVMHTLPVGDEPRGICVAGINRDRIYVATAHREDNLTPGIGRALVWVFDAKRPEAAPRVLTLFGTKPRALVASLDGRIVYAGIFLSGNRTTTVSGEDAVRMGRIPQFPRFTFNRASAVPKFGPIVAQTPSGWQDHRGEDWSPAIPFDLPDYDVFVIDAATENPVVVDRISGVGTVLFNMAVQPGSGELWVTNTEAMNLIPTEPALRSKFSQSRITRIDTRPIAGNRIRTLSLNPHIDDARIRGAPVDPALSLAQPTDLIFNPDGSEAYVAAFSSRKVGVIDADGHVIDRIDVGFGPGGLSLDNERGRLYVLNHLENSI